jgi:Ca-activated chloride channel family protein
MQTACTLIRIFSNARPQIWAQPIFLIATVLLCCFTPEASRAQDATQQAQPAIRSTAELVKVELSVADKSGSFVSGLKESSFRILDNGVERPIVFFAPVEAPAQVLVVVETSPAVYLIHNQHLFAAYELLGGLAADDQVALVTYDASPHPILAFTPNKSALNAALGQIQYTLGSAQLNFYDSVSIALDWIAPAAGKKALVLLTTGLDSSPPARWDALVQKLRGEDAVIFPVALGGSLRHPAEKKGKAPKKARNPAPQTDASTSDPENPLSWAKADAALNALAAATGGRAYFPESVNDFVAIYHEIASALRHQYVIGIVPEHDGQFHTLAVQVLDNNAPASPNGVKQPEYRVFARQGYLAPAP